MQFISQNCQLIWIDFDVHEPQTLSILSIQYSRDRTLLIWFLFKKNFDIGLHSDIYRPISFKLGMMIETTKLYILISVYMTLTLIKGHICVGNQKLCCPFLADVVSIWMKFSMFATTCWFVQAHAKFILNVIFKGENSAGMLLWKICLTSSCIWTLDLFQTWYDAKHY